MWIPLGLFYLGEGDGKTCGAASGFVGLIVLAGTIIMFIGGDAMNGMLFGSFGVFYLTVAYCILAGTHLLEIWLGLSKSPQESVNRAIELCQRAIAMDSSLAQAHMRLGYIYAAMIRQHDKGIAEGEKALALAPNSADIVNGHAMILTYAGRLNEAIPLYREALRLNPKPPNNYYRHFAVALREAGQYDEAIVQLKKAIEQEPNDPLAYLVLTTVYSYAGHQEEACSAVAEVLRIRPTFHIEQLPQGTHRDLAIVEHENEALRSAGLL